MCLCAEDVPLKVAFLLEEPFLQTSCLAHCSTFFRGDVDCRSFQHLWRREFGLYRVLADRDEVLAGERVCGLGISHRNKDLTEGERECCPGLCTCSGRQYIRWAEHSCIPTQLYVDREQRPYL